jgi:hypothetical protein
MPRGIPQCTESSQTKPNAGGALANGRPAPHLLTSRCSHTLADDAARRAASRRRTVPTSRVGALGTESRACVTRIRGSEDPRIRGSEDPGALIWSATCLFNPQARSLSHFRHFGSSTTFLVQGAPTPRKRSPSGPVSGGGPPDAACQIPRWTARRDLLSHSCHDGCALWLRNPWAGAPTLQHPPFPQVWCGPLNRTACMPVAQTDGSIPMHECRHLSPPGCFRIRLRIPPSLSWRNIGACRSAGPRITRLVAQISSVDA